MTETVPLDHFQVSVVMLREASLNQWADYSWSLIGFIPGLSQEKIKTSEQAGELHIWSDLLMTIYPLHCDSYYYNLVSDEPKAYLVCSQGDDLSLPPKPLLLTVDYDEAASYMETGEAVFSTPLPEELCVWLEQFVMTYYQPKEPKKRRRKKWHATEEKS